MREIAGDTRQGEQSNGAYGNRLAQYLNMETARSCLHGSLKTPGIAITETRDDDPVFEMSNPIPTEDAFLAQVQMRTYKNHISWEDDRPCLVGDLHAGQSILRDLKRKPAVLVQAPHHTIHFYIPRSTFDAVADDAEAQRISDLAYCPGEPIDDDVIASLGQTMRAALDKPEQANRLFVDHIMMAVAVHIAQTYGGLELKSRKARGGLAPWQECRAKEMLEAHLSGQIELSEVAEACTLSVGHFSRAFRRSTGFAPHQWLLRRRVEAAKSVMQNDRLPLADVAIECGFSDQSHFTRVFSQIMGISPAQWRRNRHA
jgi:AraC family transcriptional regulator